jgi:hypothetical protein
LAWVGHDEGVTIAPLVEWDGSDDQLAELALAADPDRPVDPDALPLDAYLGGAGDLPGWYMPAVTTRSRSRRRTATVLVIVASFLLIDGLGLCVTYGQLVAA